MATYSRKIPFSMLKRHEGAEFDKKTLAEANMILEEIFRLIGVNEEENNSSAEE